MTYAAERHAIEERAAAVRAIKPMHEKLARGQRLSMAERTASNAHLAVIERCDEEIRIAEEARGLSVEGGRRMGGSPSDSDDAETRAFSKYVRTGVVSPELRAAGDATGSAGGYLVPPGWWQRLQVALKAYGGTAADFEPLETETGQPMNWATTDPTAVEASLIAENTQISDVDYVFGQGTMGAYMITSGVQKVSFQLAQDTAFNIDQFVEARVAESLGRKVAAYAISGTGSSQPLGIITALNASSGLSSGGIYTLGTATNVNVSGASGTTGADQVTELVAGTLAPSSWLGVLKTVDPAYRALGAKWYMNDVTLQNTRLITNGFGDPFYPELQDDTAPRLYGYPVVVDNNLPALTPSTSSGVIFGHLPSAMVMRTVQGAGLLRLEERYADFLQVGYIGYRRIDMRSNDLRAAVVVQPAAS
jgi:HK97 family phage major capsid protein